MKNILFQILILDDVLLVAGVDANMAPVHGNGQINYATDNYFNSTHGLSINSYLYGSGTSDTSDMSIASNSIISNVSEGVGLLTIQHIVVHLGGQILAFQMLIFHF